MKKNLAEPTVQFFTNQQRTFSYILTLKKSLNKRIRTSFSHTRFLLLSLPSPHESSKTFSPSLLFFWETHLSVLETKPSSLLPDSFHPVQQARVERRKRRGKIGGGDVSPTHTQFEKQGNHRPVTNQEKYRFFAVSLISIIKLISPADPFPK